jgi:hypothetical protein
MNGRVITKINQTIKKIYSWLGLYIVVSTQFGLEHHNRFYANREDKFSLHFVSALFEVQYFSFVGSTGTCNDWNTDIPISVHLELTYIPSTVIAYNIYGDINTKFDLTCHI